MLITPFQHAKIRLGLLHAFVLAATAFSLSSCETAEVTRSSNQNGQRAAFAEAPHDRPGLGTKWGEQRESQAQLTDFVRAYPNHPQVVAAIYYNDATAIRSMTGAVVWHGGWAILPGLIVDIRNESGRLLPKLFDRVNNRWFVVGEEGSRYSIVLHNKTDSRFEIVVSVDGLDVIDGRKASESKRGYLLAPHSRRVIEGFRQSMHAVAAFRFSPVRESYAAEKYHNTRNVGVIGVAVFEERASILTPDAEARKRLKANPFPGRFANPPER
jgi:hypothetical protein